MTVPNLVDLDFLPYIDATGAIAVDFAQQLGLYAIYDAEKTLCYVGYSRDIQKSLQQHLVRRPSFCHWFKASLWSGDRPNRTQLEALKAQWITENGEIPVGNSTDESLWIHPIDIKTSLSVAEQQEIDQAEELTQAKLLKNHARRIEAEIIQQLTARGLTIELRFQPKLKDQGLLDLK